MSVVTHHASEVKIDKFIAEVRNLSVLCLIYIFRPNSNSTQFVNERKAGSLIQ